MLDDWRLGGSLIEDVSPRREAFNIMLSMPRGTDPLAVQRAAREFAKIELADHKYVMVLHDHQANPHVHLSVRAESKQGRRLNPRKADLQRWREVFAEQLRELGIDAEATRQAIRGQSRSYLPLWRIKAREQGRERKPPAKPKARETVAHSRAIEAWDQIERALSASSEAGDRRLALEIGEFLRGEAPSRDRNQQVTEGPAVERQPPPRSQGRTR